jgi:hypothetical protein
MTSQPALRDSAPIRNEQRFEVYYNINIMELFDLRVDIQAVDPALVDSAASLTFGLRGRVEF